LISMQKMRTKPSMSAPSQSQDFPAVAALDLGSNSFHLLLVKPAHGELRVLEKLGEKVQLAAAIDDKRELSEVGMRQALDCLRRFAQLLSGLPAGAVRAVGTSALRDARNRDHFIRRAEAILGHPIEVISGREEARLIHLGVSHSLADFEGKRLVVDIGGGSTEFIIGQRFDALLCESLHMGCVGYSKRYFADGKITPARYAQAYTAARLELMGIEHGLSRLGWQEVIGSSGTIRTIGLACQAAGFGNGEVTLEGIDWLKQRILKLGSADKLDIEGLKPDRRGIFAGGLAIIEAIFDALKLTQMQRCEGAQREGVLYDLLGRHQHEDVRERTLNAMLERCHSDIEQAARVEQEALAALEQVAQSWQLTAPWQRELLGWAARVHEIGQAVAYYHYHKHGAYLIEHADLAGFSRQDQQMLALLIRSHRRRLNPELFEDFENDSTTLLRLCVLLRFAILFHHSRGSQSMPKVALTPQKNQLEVLFPEGWLTSNPLTQADFEQEAKWLKKAGFKLVVR